MEIPVACGKFVACIGASFSLHTRTWDETAENCHLPIVTSTKQYSLPSNSQQGCQLQQSGSGWRRARKSVDIPGVTIHGKVTWPTFWARGPQARHPSALIQRVKLQKECQTWLEIYGNGHQAPLHKMVDTYVGRLIIRSSSMPNVRSATSRQQNFSQLGSGFVWCVTTCKHAILHALTFTGSTDLLRSFSTRSEEGSTYVYDPTSSSLYSNAGPIHEAQKRVEFTCNDLRDMRLVGDFSELSFLPYVCWSILVDCNLECPHCIDDKTNAEGSIELRRRIASILTESRLMGVDISGGEPLMLPDLYEVLDILALSSLAISVTTNGWLLSRHAARLAKRVNAVRVSLDAPNESDHDAIRGQGSFTRALSGIEAACEMSIPTQIQVVAMRRHAHLLPDFVQMAGDKGVSGITFLQLLPFNGGENFRDDMLTDDELISRVGEIQTKTQIPVRVRTRELAANFRVIRADGQIWANDSSADAIGSLRLLNSSNDLVC